MEVKSNIRFKTQVYFFSKDTTEHWNINCSIMWLIFWDKHCLITETWKGYKLKLFFFFLQQQPVKVATKTGTGFWLRLICKQEHYFPVGCLHFIFDAFLFNISLFIIFHIMPVFSNLGVLKFNFKIYFCLMLPYMFLKVVFLFLINMNC